MDPYLLSGEHRYLITMSSRVASLWPTMLLHGKSGLFRDTGSLAHDQCGAMAGAMCLLSPYSRDYFSTHQCRHSSSKSSDMLAKPWNTACSCKNLGMLCRPASAATRSVEKASGRLVYSDTGDFVPVSLHVLYPNRLVLSAFCVAGRLQPTLAPAHGGTLPTLFLGQEIQYTGRREYLLEDPSTWARPLRSLFGGGFLDTRSGD